MSIDPNELLTRLRCSVSAQCHRQLQWHELEWLLAQLKHRDDQIEALRSMVKVKPTPAPHVPAPGELARTAAFLEPILGLPPGAISDNRVALCLEAADLSRRCG